MSCNYRFEQIKKALSDLVASMGVTGDLTRMLTDKIPLSYDRVYYDLAINGSPSESQAAKEILKSFLSVRDNSSTQKATLQSHIEALNCALAAGITSDAPIEQALALKDIFTLDAVSSNRAYGSTSSDIGYVSASLVAHLKHTFDQIPTDNPNDGIFQVSGYMKRQVLCVGLARAILARNPYNDDSASSMARNEFVQMTAKLYEQDTSEQGHVAEFAVSQLEDFITHTALTAEDRKNLLRTTGRMLIEGNKSPELRTRILGLTRLAQMTEWELNAHLIQTGKKQPPQPVSRSENTSVDEE